MIPSGRGYSPGDVDSTSVANVESVHNRTIRAQVTKVIYKDGYVEMTYESLPGGSKVATVPPLWMSFPKPSVGGPAWGRFMPQESDIVKVSFDYNDEPRIVGYDVIAFDKAIAYGYAGWPKLKDQNDKYVAGNKSRPQFANFTALEPGEYDFMSSGGAYIYGNKSGRLYMMGGGVSIALTKNENSITTVASLAIGKSADSEIRFGQVRRPVAGLEKTLVADATGAYKEFNVLVNGPTKIPLASVKMGNVAGLATVDMSSKGQPLRYSLETNADATPLPTFSMKVDSAGNTELAGKTASLSTEYVDATMKATASHTVESPNIKLGGTGSNNPLLLTTVYGPAEQQVITQLATQVSALQAQVTAITIAMTAYTAAVSLAYPPAAAGATAWAAALVPITAGLAAVTANVQAAATTFTSNYPNYESKNTFTS